MALPERPYPWQQRQWQLVAASRHAGRLHHALLLAGPAGIGKAHFAELLAISLLCEAPDAEGLPCGGCRSCLLIAAGNHPDLVRIAPEEEGKGIAVGQIRELERVQSLKALYRGKVVIIDPADRMNVNASNALLKTLEEPTASTHLLLVTARPRALLPTIRSRCQKLAFPPADGPDVEAWMAGEGVSTGVTHLLGMTGGAPLAAVACAKEGSLERRADALAQWRAVAEGEADPVLTAGRWATEGLAERLRWLYFWLGDLVRLRLGLVASEPALAGSLQTGLEGLDLTDLFSRLDAVQKAIRDTQGQLNAQLVAEEVLIPWAPIRRPQPRR